jgi:hypothetical protein
MEFAEAGALNPPFKYFMFSAVNFFDDGKECFIWGRQVTDEAVEFYIATDKYEDFFMFDYKKSWKNEKVFEGKIFVDIEYKAFVDQRVQAFFQFLIMLNHPVYEKETVLAPVAVNKKREKSGKTKLLDYIRVKMNAAVKASLSSGESSGTVRKPHCGAGGISGDAIQGRLCGCSRAWSIGEAKRLSRSCIKWRLNPFRAALGGPWTIEELAELHAIIQAIEYERRSGATSPDTGWLMD